MRNVLIPVGELPQVLVWTQRKRISVLVIDDRAYVVRPGHEPLMTRLVTDPMPVVGRWHRVLLDDAPRDDVHEVLDIHAES